MNSRKLTQNEVAECVELIRGGTEQQRSQASEKLLLSLDRMIRDMAIRKFPAFVRDNLEDMVQSAYLSLIENLDRYDDSRGRWSTFASYYILHGLQVCASGICGQTRYFSGALSKTVNAAEELEAELGSVPDIRHIAEKSSLSEGAVKEAVRRMPLMRTVSFDTGDCISVSDLRTPETCVIEDETRTVVSNYMDAYLTEEEKSVLRMYYGIGSGGSGMTHCEIARELGIRPDRVYPVRRSAEKKLSRNRNLRRYWRNT